MGDLGSKYSIKRPTKYLRNDLTTRDKFNIHQESNSIFNHSVGEILLKKNNKVSSESEAHENIESDIDENYLYCIDNTGLDENK